MKSNIVDLEVVYRIETEAAVMVSSDEDAENVWLPKSQVEMEPGEFVAGYPVEVSMPEHLAIEKDLI